MDVKIKAKWLKALRSGKYKQAKEQLRAGDGYCCLGVLCVAVLGVKIDYDSNTIDPAYHAAYAAIGDPTNREISGELIKMNDGGTPFAEIADYIEKNL